MVNPLYNFYEWYLTFFNGLPFPFKALQGLVWGFTLVFFLMNLFTRIMK